MRYFKKLKIALLVFLMTLSVSTYVQAATYQTGTYKTNKKIYVYLKASTKAKKLTSIKKAVKVSVNAISGKYGKVSYNSQSGYIYLPYTSYVYVKGTYTANKKIYVYAKKSTKGKKLTSVSKGTAVTVTLVSGKYGKVTYNGKTGYIYLPYTTYKKEMAKTVSASTKTSETSEGQTETPVTQESQEPVNEEPQIPTQETAPSEEQEVSSSSQSQSTSEEESSHEAASEAEQSVAEEAGSKEENADETSEVSSESETEKSTEQTEEEDVTPESNYPAGTYVMTATGNLRSAPDLTGEVLTTIPKGQVITVISVENVKWGSTSYHGKSGYVSLKNASLRHVVESEEPEGYQEGAYETQYLCSLRVKPSISAASVINVPANTTFRVTKIQDDCWAYVTYQNVSGYLNLNNTLYIMKTTGSYKQTLQAEVDQGCTHNALTKSAAEVADYLTAHCYTYVAAKKGMYSFPIANVSDLTTISCSSYMQEVLYQAGYTQYAGEQVFFAAKAKDVGLSYLTDYGVEARLLEDEEDVQPGDIVQRCAKGHVAMVYKTTGNVVYIYEVSPKGFHINVKTKEDLRSTYYVIRILS